MCVIYNFDPPGTVKLKTVKNKFIEKPLGLKEDAEKGPVLAPDAESKNRIICYRILT